MLSNTVKKDKIVLSINSLQGAGAERFILTIGAAFHQLGFDVNILCFDPKVEFNLDRNLTYHLIDYRRYKWLPKGAARYSTLAKKVDSYIIKNIGNPILVLSNLERSDNIFRYSKLPNIVHVIHSTLSLYYEFDQLPDAEKLKLRVKNIYSKHPCVCVSDGVKNDLLKHLGDITSAEVIHNPTDREEVRRLAELFIPEKQDYIIHVGSFKKAKRHDILLKAYAQSNQTLPLLLLGQGKLKENIERLIVELGISHKVTLLGFCENPYPYIKHAQVKVLTSDREGFPMVLPEALALGVPVISTDCESGPREILPERNLMSINDVNAIANKLNQAMENPKQFYIQFDESLLPAVIAKKYLETVQYNFS